MLTHVTRNKINLGVRPTLLAEQKSAPKPRGFWYSVNGDWEEWCKYEMPEWGRGTKYEVILGQENLLRLASAKDIDQFTEKYGEDPIQLRTIANMHIRWQEVAALYDGIEISPYIHERRMFHRTSWYYTWDCASGCIWTPRGVVLRELEQT